MTAIIVKFQPALFSLPPSRAAEAVGEPQKSARKRSGGEAEVDAEAEAVPAEKRQKIEDDLTPAAVDTSTV